MAIVDRRLEHGGRVIVDNAGSMYISEGDGTILIHGDADLETVRRAVEAAIAIRKAQS